MQKLLLKLLIWLGEGIVRFLTDALEAKKAFNRYISRNL